VRAAVFRTMQRGKKGGGEADAGVEWPWVLAEEPLQLAEQQQVAAAEDLDDGASGSEGTRGESGGGGRAGAIRQPVALTAR
jgi:hypothetical protein